MQEYGWFEVLFYLCGPIGWVLWIISLGTLGLMIKYFISIRRGVILPDLTFQQYREQIDARRFKEAIEVSGVDTSYLGRVVHASLSEAPHGYAAMERALEGSAEQETTKLLRSVEWLNLIGNIGPMLGLMGTVWGMIQVFFKIVEVGGQPKPDQLAGGIGTALVTTLLGLAIAIPSLAVYAVLRNMIDACSSEVMLRTQELISVFRPARRTGAG